METAVWSRSSLESLARWRATRLPWWMLTAAPLFLWAAGLAAGLPDDAPQAGMALAAAALLFVQFRLWDDLADLPDDRLAHPERVLCRAASRAPFRAAAAALAAANAALFAFMGHSAIRLAGFALLGAGLLAWYRFRRAAHGFANAQVVLVKYPVITALVCAGPSPTAALLLAMLAVYLGFSVYEILHDRRLAARPGASWVLATEMIALCATVALMVGIGL